MQSEEDTTYSFPQKMPEHASIVDDGSFVNKEKSTKNVVVIEDPKHEATLRIIRAK